MPEFWVVAMLWSSADAAVPEADDEDMPVSLLARSRMRGDADGDAAVWGTDGDDCPRLDE